MPIGDLLGHNNLEGDVTDPDSVESITLPADKEIISGQVLKPQNSDVAIKLVLIHLTLILINHLIEISFF